MDAYTLQEIARLLAAQWILKHWQPGDEQTPYVVQGSILEQPVAVFRTAEGRFTAAMTIAGSKNPLVAALNRITVTTRSGSTPAAALQSLLEYYLRHLPEPE